MLLWNPDGITGDYVAIVGREERLSDEDRDRMGRNLPTIVDSKDLHFTCTDEF